MIFFNYKFTFREALEHIRQELEDKKQRASTKESAAKQSKAERNAINESILDKLKAFFKTLFTNAQDE